MRYVSMICNCIAKKHLSLISNQHSTIVDNVTNRRFIFSGSTCCVDNCTVVAFILQIIDVVLCGVCDFFFERERGNELGDEVRDDIPENLQAASVFLSSFLKDIPLSIDALFLRRILHEMLAVKSLEPLY